MSDPKPTEPPAPEPTRPQPSPVLDGRQLFGGAREICIDFDGVRYRLRVTRRNKLILQK
jgi:hemin uptake protein HemP